MALQYYYFYSDDRVDLVPFDDEDADYFSGIQEALQSNFAFSSEEGDEMQTFGERLNNDYTGPPLIPEDELEHSSDDEFDGPYATADQVAQKEKRAKDQQVNEGGLKQSTYDTESNDSSHSGTYVSSASVRAKKRQDRSTVQIETGSSKNDEDDDTGFSPLPVGTLKLDNYSENSLVNSDSSLND